MSVGEKTKLLWQNPDYRKHMSEVHKGYLAEGTLENLRKMAKERIGKIGYWNNKERTEITKTKMSLSHIGKNKGIHPVTEFKKGHFSFTKGKKGYWKDCFGKNSPSWKGGRCSLNILIRSSLEYKQWRESVFKRDNYTCQKCGQKGGKLHSHHKNKFFTQILQEFLQQYNQFSPIEDKETLLRLATKYQPFWDIDNGETFCRDCHKKMRRKNVKILEFVN